MKTDIPKVLHILQGKPLIQHVIDNIRGAGITDIVVVVGYRADMVVDTIGNSVTHIWQQEQLGTGHAVLQTENALAGFHGNVLIACGDAPLIQSSTFRKLVSAADGEGVKATVLTMIQEDPSGYGRVITDANSMVVRIVEEKDATAAEKRIREVNTGTYVFDKEVLFAGLRVIGRDNAQGEYYLPDVLQYIRGIDYRVKKVVLEDPLEGSGINSKEELEKLEKYLAGRGGNTGVRRQD